MSKRNALILAILAMFTSYGAAQAIPSAFGYDLEADMHRSERQQQAQQNQIGTPGAAPSGAPAEQPQVDYTPKTAKDLYSFVPLADLFVPNIDNKTFYSNPTMSSAIYKYKKGNYTGSLQELYSYIKKKPNDPYAFYYMGLNYTRIGEKDVAAKCFQKVINCNAKGQLLAQAVKGRDCLNGGIYCTTPLYPTTLELYNGVLLDPNDPLDQFIAAPYSGSGFSPEAEREVQQRRMNTQMKKLNQGQGGAPNNQSALPVFEKIAMAADVTTAEPTNEEVLNAIDVLKRAGLNITAGDTTSTVETTSDVVSEKKNQPSFVNPEYEAINMMMGNNNNNNDPMTTMLPYMLNSNENGKNIDPQIIQAVMMNSMMSSLNGLNSTDSNK